jgi:hypothetical protein
MPVSYLDNATEEEMEQKVELACSDVLGVDSLRVTAAVQQAEHGNQTDLEVSLLPADGESVDELADLVNSSFPELHCAVAIALQASPDGCESDWSSIIDTDALIRFFDENSVYILCVWLALCCLCLLSCIICKASGSKQEVGTTDLQEATVGRPLVGSDRGQIRNSPSFSASPTKPPGETSEREELTLQVFQKFDLDRDSHLNKDEMMAFAMLCCEFDGTEEEWNEEYGAICSDYDINQSPGISLELFRNMINDSGNEGDDVVPATFCASSVLRRVLLPPREWVEQDQSVP